MVKMIVLGFVAVIATLGGAYAGLQMSFKQKSGTEVLEQDAVELVKLDPTSVPVIRDGSIAGYVIVRSAYLATAKDIKQIRPQMTAYVTEAIFINVYGDEAANFTGMKPIQVEALAERAAKGANTRLARDAIKRITLEHINYLTVEEARNQQGSDKAGQEN